MGTRRCSSSRRGAANKGLIVVLVVLIVAAVAVWFTSGGKGRDPSTVQPSDTRKVALVDPATGKVVVEVTETELKTWETSGGFFKHPETGEFTLTVMKAGSSSVLTPGG